jgi:hypothetical protein
MAEVLGKHTRDVDASCDQSKRIKKPDASRGLEQQLMEKIKRAERLRAAAQAKEEVALSQSLICLPENYFKPALREGSEAIHVPTFAKDTGERYELQLKKLQDQQRATSDNERKLKAVEEAASKFKTDSQLKHQQTREVVATLKERKMSEERRLRGEIERLKQQQSHYALLSGVKIAEDSKQGVYRFLVRVQQNELVFKVHPHQTDADVEPERASVAKGKLPDFLCEPISLELDLLPELLLRSLNALM